MSWQDAGVVLIVGAAAVYLVRTFIWRPKRPTKVTTTFIPLERVKRPDHHK